MIVTKCPLRISLVGGSTDLQTFLDKYDWGSVISFPANIYTYITLKRMPSNYRIVYSIIENTSNIKDIKNDVAREVLLHFDVPPVEITFNADIPSEGSGLASSTSYMIAMIYAISELLELNLTQFDVCKLALKMERNFNPLTGYQDSYGCGIGGFKRMFFYKDGKVKITYLPSDILRKNCFYLIPTHKTRSSTKILSTIDIDSLVQMRNLTDIMENHIGSNYSFHQAIEYSWEIKKKSSPEIFTDDLKKMENDLKKMEDVRSLKLCGAGGGGYFLVITELPKPYIERLGIRIKLDDKGVTSTHI